MHVTLIAALAILGFAAGPVRCDFPAPKAPVDLRIVPSYRWLRAFEAICDKTPQASLVDLVKSVAAMYAGHGCDSACITTLANIIVRRWPAVYVEAIAISEEFLRRTKLNVTADFIAGTAFVYELTHVQWRGGPRRDLLGPTMGCTSWIGCAPNGRTVFGRNLDWDSTSLYRNITLMAEWQANQTTLSRDPHFLMDLGTVTGVRKGAFAISINFRGGAISLNDLIQCASDPQSLSPVSITIRNLIDGSPTSVTTFKDVVTLFNSGRMCTPAYVNIAGPRPGEGVILTKETNAPGSLNPNWLKCSEDSWFLVQTNNDWWIPPPKYDDRAGVAREGLLRLGRARATSPSGMFEVLSILGNQTVRGVLNSMTVFSAAMFPDTGELVTVVRTRP